MGSGFSSGNTSSMPKVYINPDDCSIDADLAAALQQSEVEARSQDLAMAMELQQTEVSPSVQTYLYATY